MDPESQLSVYIQKLKQYGGWCLTEKCKKEAERKEKEMKEAEEKERKERERIERERKEKLIKDSMTVGRVIRLIKNQHIDLLYLTYKDIEINNEKYTFEFECSISLALYKDRDTVYEFLGYLTIKNAEGVSSDNTEMLKLIVDTSKEVITLQPYNKIYSMEFKGKTNTLVIEPITKNPDIITVRFSKEEHKQSYITSLNL